MKLKPASVGKKVIFRIVFFLLCCTFFAYRGVAQCGYSFTTSVTNVSCYNGTSGSITVNVTGSSTYRYQLSQASSGGWGTNNVFSGLSAGTYPVSVEDFATGCASTVYVTLTQPAALSVGYTAADASCAGANNGSINLAVTGGTAPYTYAWTQNGTAYASTANLAGLSPANYQVIVTDAKGCTASPAITAQVRPVTIASGFTDKVVATGTTVPSSTATNPIDNCGSNGNVYFQSGYTYGGSTPGGGLPASGSFTSANIPANTYQLASYASNNSMIVRASGDAGCGGTTSGTLTFQSAYQAPYSTLYVLGTTGSGTGTVNYTVNFSDATTYTGSLTFLDWATTSSQSAIGSLNRVQLSGSFDLSAKFNLYEQPIAIPAGSQTKTVNSISFSYNTGGSGRISIMGVTAYTSTVYGIRVNDGPASNVTPAVSVSSNTPTNTLCAGQNVTFTATPVYGGNSPSYQWKVNGTNAGTNSATFSTTTLNNNDVVTVVLTSSLSCVLSANATSSGLTMHVNSTVSPTVSVAGSANGICSGSPVTFTATPVYGGPSPTYQWQVNGSNAGTNSATFSSSALNNNDIVQVIMSSNIGCTSGNPSPVTSNSITMAVTATVTPTLSISSSASNIHPGNTVNFSSSVTAAGSSPAYQWYQNGVAINSATSASYSTNSISNGDQFALKLTSNASCATSSIIMSNYLQIFTTLPVTLQSFTLQQNQGDVLLKWITTYEFNNKSYLVQREKLPATQFTTIATVAAVTTPGTSNTYTYTDQPGEAGTYLYRLLQTDMDGNQEILGGVKQAVIGTTTGWQLLDMGNAWQLNTPQPLNYRLVDVLGRLIKEDSYTGSRLISKPLSSSIYLLIINYNGKLYTKELLK